MYHGETARNIHVRSEEHYSAFKNKSEKSFMYKHVLKSHEGNSNDIIFDWKIKRELSEALE